MSSSRRDSHCFKTRLWVGCSVACLCTAVVALAQTLPGTAAPGNPFEVHGLLYSGSAPAGFPLGDAWAQGATQFGVLDANGNPAVDGDGVPFRASRQIDPNWGNQGDGIDFTLFAGSNKNSHLIGVTDSPWGWDVGTGGPQKNDITNAYFHTRVDPATGDRWVFVAADTRSTNGDSHVDFEFNQAGILKTEEGEVTEPPMKEGVRQYNLWIGLLYPFLPANSVVNCRRSWPPCGRCSTSVTMNGGPRKRN